MLPSSGNIVLVGFLWLVVVHVDGNQKKKDARIYTFAFSNDGFPANYIENGELVGQSVDLVKAVCKFAEKKCKTSVVQRSQCWDNSMGFPPFSMALNNGWFGSCANLPPNPERRLSYSFGKEDFFRTPEPSVIVKTDSKITVKHLEGCHDLTLAFAANTAVEPDCLLDAGYFVKTENMIPVLTQGVFDLPTIMRKIAELVKNGTVDMGLVIPRFLITNGEIRTLIDVPCAREVPLGLNVMMKHNDAEFIEWWSYYVHKFMCSPKYKRFCENQEEIYGIDPLCRVPGKDLDCTAFDGPTKSIKPVEPHRINPCIGKKCPHVKVLNYGQTFYNIKDHLGNSVSKALAGSNDMYTGELEEDVRFIIQIGNGLLFSVNELCVTVKDAKALKFIFRGGQREASEVDVPVSSENKWTLHCVKHKIPRRLVVIKFRVAERQTPDKRVKVKLASMEGCLQQMG